MCVIGPTPVDQHCTETKGKSMHIFVIRMQFALIHIVQPAGATSWQLPTWH